MGYRKSFLCTIALAVTLALSACAQPAQPTPSPTKPAAPQAAPTAAPAAPTKAPAAPAATPTPVPPAATAAPAAQAKPLSPPVKVKYGSIGTLGGIAVFIALEKGYFKDEGLDVEMVNFRTGGDMIPALSQGQLDVGSGAISAGLFNAIARDINLKLVAEPSTVERSEGIAVRADLANQIKDWADLKGRKVALSSTASGVEIKFEEALKKGGLTMKDVQIETMGFPDMLTAFSNKAIDAAILTEPTTTAGVDRGVLVRWKLAEDIRKGHQVGVVMFASKFAKENNEAAKRFTVAQMRAARDFYEFLQSGKGKADIVAAAIKYSNVKDPKIYDKMYWPGINPDLAMNVKSVQTDIEWYVQKGYVKQPPALSDIIDNSFVEAAVQRLGPAKR